MAHPQYRDSGRELRRRRGRSAVPAALSLLLALLAVSPPAGAFELIGLHWRSGEAPYRLRPNFPDTGRSGTREEQLEMLRAAAAAWRDQSRARFRFTDGSAIARSGIDLKDGVNTVGWVDEDSPDALAVTVIGGTRPNRATAFDIVFFARTNGSENLWNGPRDPPPGTVDMTGVAVHEFGHALGLDHTPVELATMTPAIFARGLPVRTLEPDDLAGVHELYGDDRPGADPGPAILSVTPDRGPLAGGNEVVLRGRNFTWTGNTGLRVNGALVPASAFEVESLQRLRVKSMPPGRQGEVDVELANALGQSSLPSGYFYEAPAPALIGIEPAVGPLEGGIAVLVRGTGISGEAVVRVGGAPLLEATVVDSEAVEGFLPPADGEGLADVELVQTGDTASLPDAFTYTASRLEVGQTAARPGGNEAAVAVRATTDRDLAGLSFGLRWDPDTVDVTALETAGATADAGAMADAVIDSTGGLASLTVTGPPEGDGVAVPSGEDRTVARILLRVLPDAAPQTTAPLRLVDGAGDPPVEVVFLPRDGGSGRRPYRVDGAVEVISSLPFLRGDADGDGSVGLADAIAVLDAVFRGGPDLPCRDAADANDDGWVDVSDPIRVLLFLFQGVEPPPAPWPAAGPDPTDDALRCG